MAPLLTVFAGRELSAGQIEEICRAGGFTPMTVCLPNDHSVQMEDATEAPNEKPFCMNPQSIENCCWALGFPIFTRIAPRQGYIVSQQQHWCDGTII